MTNPSLLVAGELRDTAQRQPVLNPATGQPVGQSPLADADLVDEAVRAAHAAFPSWAAVPVPGEPNTARSGLDFTHAASSLTERTGTFPLTARA